MTSLSFLHRDFYTGMKNQTIFRREFVKTFFGEMKTILSHREEEGFSQKLSKNSGFLPYKDLYTCHTFSEEYVTSKSC